MHVQVRPVKFAYADITSAPCFSAWGMDVQELLRLAMEAAGIDPADPRRASKLAHALDLGGFNLPQRVRRWLDGETKPDYDATLALLRLAKLLGPPREGLARKTIET